MLLNKKILASILILFLLVLNSCGGNKNQESNKIDYENPEVVLQQAKNVLGENVQFAYKGKFDQDSVVEIAAGSEIQNNKEWGIKIELLKLEDGKLVRTFQTPLLNGSFKKCLFQKIKFPVFNYELVYYNSQDYFLGSGGGEVYSYIINFNEGRSYYAHLISEQDQPVMLYLSNNIDVPEIKNFFMSIFKRDYPSYTVVDKDIEMRN